MNEEIIRKAQEAGELLNRIDWLKNAKQETNCMAEIKMYRAGDSSVSCTIVSERDGDLFERIRKSIKEGIDFEIYASESKLQKLFEPITDVGTRTF